MRRVVDLHCVYYSISLKLRQASLLIAWKCYTEHGGYDGVGRIAGATLHNFGVHYFGLYQSKSLCNYITRPVTTRATRVDKLRQKSSVTCGSSTTLPDTKYDHSDDHDQQQDCNHDSEYQLQYGWTAVRVT